MALAPSITLLHLSDLQFGPHHRFEGPSAPGGLLHRLRGDLARMRDDEGLKPDLVLLTGDLTECGLKSQFTELLSFVNGLVEVTENSGPRRIVVVPGNHGSTGSSPKRTSRSRGGQRGESRPCPTGPSSGPCADFFAPVLRRQPGLIVHPGRAVDPVRGTPS